MLHLRRTGLSPLSEQTPPPCPSSCCSPPAPRCLPARRLALETRSSPALSLERCRWVPAPPASQARSYPPTFVFRFDRGGEPFSFPRRRHRCEAPGRGGGGGGVGLGSTPFAWMPSPARAKRPPRPPTPMVHAWVAAAFGGETSQFGLCSPHRPVACPRAASRWRPVLARPLVSRDAVWCQPHQPRRLVLIHLLSFSGSTAVASRSRFPDVDTGARRRGEAVGVGGSAWGARPLLGCPLPRVRNDPRDPPRLWCTRGWPQPLEAKLPSLASALHTGPLPARAPPRVGDPF